MTNEIKVTEYSAAKSGLSGKPYISGLHWECARQPAILMWRDDYDAMRKELEELRAERKKLIAAGKILAAHCKAMDDTEEHD